MSQLASPAGPFILQHHFGQGACTGIAVLLCWCGPLQACVPACRVKPQALEVLGGLHLRSLAVSCPASQLNREKMKHLMSHSQLAGEPQPSKHLIMSQAMPGCFARGCSCHEAATTKCFTD